MLKLAIIQAVGESAFAEACGQARAEAAKPDYGRGESWTSDIPHAVADELWSAAVPPEEAVEALFSLYDDLPAYGLLMYTIHQYVEWPAGVRERYWADVRARLGGPDPALAAPLSYCLWCDWFEDSALVVEAWTALTARGATPTVLRRVLAASGPVPYDLKRALYERLVDRPEWHADIFGSLLHSAFDVFGQIDRVDARRWLGRLQLPESTPHLDKLRANLS